MFSSRVRLSISHSSLLLTLLVLALVCLASGSASASYGTQGGFSVNTEGGSFVSRNIPFSTTLEISDQDVSIGGAGNNATAAYSASIINAAVSASTSAQNAPIVPGSYWSANGSVQPTHLRDELRFTIPAGFYPSGLEAVARVRVIGSVGVSQAGATARHIYSVQFGSGVATAVTDAPAPNLDAYLRLTEQLVAPGTTLNSPTMLPWKPVIASVESHSSAPGEVAQAASSDISVEVLCIRVPSGVTWVSESGALGVPSCSEDAIPGLTGWALAALALVLIGSGVWMAVGGRRELT